MSTARRRPDEDDDAQTDRERHPASDPSGDEPSGSSTGLPDRSFAGSEFAEAESEQARGRRESAATREDNGLGGHDQEFGDTRSPH